MRTIFKIAITAAAAVALALSSADVSAQSRSSRSGGSSSRGTTGVSRSSGSASRSSGSVSSGSATRSSGSISSGGANRSNGSVSRSSGSASQQTTSRARGGTVSRSTGTTRSSGTGSSVGSASRSSGSTGSRSSAGVSRSAGSSTGGSSGRGTSTRATERENVKPGTSHGGADRGYNAGRSYDRQTAGPAGQVRFDHRGDRIPPRHRDFMPYDRPGRFFGHDPHYFGYRVRYLPTYRRVRFWGIDYFIYNDIYYRYYLGNYIICRPPFGVLFDISLYRLELDVLRFAYYNNVYRSYNVIDSNYDTIQEQNRIIAENNATIAAQNATIAANNATAAAQQAARASAAAPEVDLNTLKSAASYELATKLGLVQSFAAANIEYYYDDGVFFTSDNDSQYKVIVPPAGALIKALPDDYDTVTLSDGNTYFKVDDTIYRTTVVDGVPYFEVLGQMPEKMARQYARAD